MLAQTSTSNKVQTVNFEKKTRQVLIQAIKDESGKLHIPFNPQDHGLPTGFRLTNYGNNEKLTTNPNHNDLQALLSTFLNDENHQKNSNGDHQPIILSEGLTSTYFENSELILLETINLLPAIIDEPYYYGYIACTMVMSGLYAEGISWCTTHRMMLNLSTKMSLKERNIIIPLITQGYLDAATKHGVKIQGIRVTESPILSIGGSITSMNHRQMYIKYQFAVPDDVLILTKPLGTTIALLLSKLFKNPDESANIQRFFSPVDVEVAACRAIDWMSQSNLKAAYLIQKYNAHAVCEIGPHGLLGHADILLKQHVMNLNFVISNLPVISKMDSAAKLLGYTIPFFRGTQPEVSGGLLIAMSKDQANLFLKDFEKFENHKAWIIGIVEAGNRQVKIKENPRIIEFPQKLLTSTSTQVN